MRLELIVTLTSIKNEDTMQRLLLNMDAIGLDTLLSLLEFTNEDTKNRWMKAYNNLLKN